MLHTKYRSLDAIIFRLSHSEGIYVTYSSLETKFTKPEHLSGWEKKIDECVEMVDILWGIGENIVKESNHYNSELKTPTFYRATTVSVNYDANNYKFIITSGEAISEIAIFMGKQHKLSTNSRISYVAQAYESKLMSLVHQMKDSLPRARYDEIISKCKIPKNRLPNSYVYFK